MRGWPDDEVDHAPSCPELLEFIAEGCYGNTAEALRLVSGLVPVLEQGGDPELLLVGLWGQAVLQREVGAPASDCEATCDRLEQAARDDGGPVWVALACALRAVSRLDVGDVGLAMGHLARVDLDLLTDELPLLGGPQLLDVLAIAYSRLRLHDQVDDVRARAQDFLAARPPLDRAVHWAHAATELAVRALEPLASGSDVPDLRVLSEARDVATQLSTVPPDLVPDQLRRGADGVRALAAAYRDRPEEALRLLGDDGFDQPDDLPWLERQLTTLAAIHAHVLLGGTAMVRALDDGADAPPTSLTHLVLEVCRARERLTVESRTGGDAVQVITRLSRLLSQLAWLGMDLMAGAARQTLEHQALRVESRTDALTGVGNRRALDEELRNLLRFSPLPLSLVLVDVDDFKRVNDRFTHVAGDEVLRRVATTLATGLRTGDRLVRYGGDEFVVLMPLTSDAEADALGTRMAEAVGGLDWEDVAPGLSVAVTTGRGTLWSLSHRRPDGDAEQLFRLADEHLLAAKRRRGAAIATVPRGRRAASAPAAEPGEARTSEASSAAAAPAAPASVVPRPAVVAAPTPAAEPTPTPAPAPAAKPTGTPFTVSPDLSDPLLGPLPPEAAQAPLSPAFGLPLYRALLQNPPRVDPHLGTLPPADPAEQMLTPLGLVLPTLTSRATPTTNGSAPSAAPQAPANGSSTGAPTAGRTRPPTRPPTQTPSAQLRGGRDRGDRASARLSHAADHAVDRASDREATPPDAPDEPKPTRPRRRPSIIDLSRDDDRRTPFG